MAAALVVPIAYRAQPASADQIADTQAQANQLAAQIASQGSRIHQLSEQYDQAQVQLDSVSQKLATSQAALSATVAEVRARQAEVKRQAVQAYLEGPAGGGTAALLAGDLGHVQLRQEYLAFANSDIRGSIDDLHTAEAQLRSQEASLASAQQAAAADAAGLAHDRQQLTAEASQEESTLSQVQGQLASMVAEAEAARYAAASAQRRQAEEAAAQVRAPSVPSGQPLQGGVASFSSPSAHPGGSGDPFAEIRQCESGDNYSADTGNGYYGAYQISAATWQGLGYSGLPNQAPPAVQDEAARRLQAQSGWGQWPTCAAMLGLT